MLRLSRREVGFELVDGGDGALCIEGIRVTARDGWIHVMLPDDRGALPDALPLRVELDRRDGELVVEVTTTVDHVDLETGRLAIVVALQSEWMRRVDRARARRRAPKRVSIVDTE